MIKVGIIGATGYVGAELTRLLLSHPKVKLYKISSKSYKGEKLSNVYTNFFNVTDLICEDIDDVIKECDVIFTTLPHGYSEEIIYKSFNSGKLSIDLGADFRLDSEDSYEKWYGKKFSEKSLHKYSVYGLPELNREKIKNSKIIGNPGCYPTSIELALLPLLKNNMIETKKIICDSKSGVTGSGRGLSESSHYTNVNENFNPYKIGYHRHIPEIEETLTKISHDDVNIIFTPHLLPINRGILSTIYCTLKDKNLSLDKIHETYDKFYRNEPFVNILPLNEIAKIKDVTLSNNCNISLHLNHRKDELIIISTIDNMLKGASGQAIQNMNIALGFDEKCGLNLIPTPF
ncbi:N-acetyl-gamma-glutamyl-phosphate reductase [Clostridium baratii]|uniref:N-acetyl-gamma-glutamyl-phosphate reductase n=1 Tax=Clostridium baratii TaxID=1561 RepID=UPI0030D2299E